MDQGLRPAVGIHLRHGRIDGEWRDVLVVPVSTTKALVLSWPDAGLDETVLPVGPDFAARLNDRMLWWPPARGLLVSLEVESHPLPDDASWPRCAPETVARRRGSYAPNL